MLSAGHMKSYSINFTYVDTSPLDIAKQGEKLTQPSPKKNDIPAKLGNSSHTNMSSEIRIAITFFY